MRRAEPLLGALRRLADRPRLALGGLVVVHWLAVAAFALTVRHNGLVYYQGGDQILYSTTAWLAAQGDLAPTFTGYAWVLPLLPVALLGGADYVSYLPWIMFLNVGILAPVALAAVWGLASRLAGRLFALWASALWVAAPFAVIPLFRDDYHERFVEQFLPQALGLTGLADYPSMVCLLVAAYLLIRAFDAPDWTWATSAGLAVGVAGALKPANLLFLAAPLLAGIAARRLTLAIPFTAGLAPPLVLLLVWKLRGLGGLPAFAAPEAHLAAGAAALGVLGVDVGRYFDYDLDVLRSNMANLREYFWSVRLLQWAPLAGLLAVGRRSLPLAALLGGWLFAFLLTKGTVTQSTVESGSFFRLLMPAYPAFFLLAAAIPLLVPPLGRATHAVVPPRPLSPRLLAVLTVAFVVVPLALVLVPRPLDDDPPAAVSVNEILVPVDDRIEVEVAAQGERRTLTWTHPDFGSTKVFYKVFRTEGGEDDVDCIGDAARECRLQMLTLETTRDAAYVDGSPPADARYRVGIATNWKDDAEGGDVIAVSPPVAAGG